MAPSSSPQLPQPRAGGPFVSTKTNAQGRGQVTPGGEAMVSRMRNELWYLGHDAGNVMHAQDVVGGAPVRQCRRAAA